MAEQVREFIGFAACSEAEMLLIAAAHLAPLALCALVSALLRRLASSARTPQEHKASAPHSFRPLQT